MNSRQHSLVVLAIVLLLSTGQSQAAENCQACHGELPASSHGAVHEGLTCASCHADSSEHAIRPRQVAPGQSFGSAEAGRTEPCLACHQEAGSHWPASSHSREDLSCSSCHEVTTAERALVATSFSLWAFARTLRAIT